MHLNITGEQIHCSPVNGSVRLFAHILAVPNQGVRAKSLDSGSENPLKGSILFNFWHISVMFEVHIFDKKMAKNGIKTISIRMKSHLRYHID